MEMLPLEESADRCPGELCTSLENNGMPIGPNEMIIAAHALAQNCVVITANVREYPRVPGLSVENWLEK